MLIPDVIQSHLRRDSEGYLFLVFRYSTIHHLADV